MGATQITSQPSLSGGLNVTTDPLKTKPEEWIAANNFMVGRPGGGGNATPGVYLSAMTAPPIRIPSPDTSDTFSYKINIPKRLSIAKLDSTENWTLDTYSIFISPISQGNNCINISNSSTATATESLFFNSPLDISSVFNKTNENLLIDFHLFRGGGIGHIFFYNSNQSNYAEYSLIPSGIPGNLTCPFVLTGGTFDPTAVISISIVMNIQAGPPSTSMSFSDLRFENSITNGFITNSISFGQGIGATAPDGTALSNQTEISAIIGCQDMVLIGLYPFSAWKKLVVGFPHESLIDSPIGSNFYFAQYPDPNNPAQNILVMMDGASFPVQYTPTKNPGNQFANILAGAPEIQTVTFSDTPASGNFTLSFNGQTTGNIAWNASASTIQTDLQGLSSIGSGNILVSGSIAAGASLTFTFAGTLSSSKQNLITAPGGGNTLQVSSGTVGISISVGGLQNVQQVITPNQVATGGSYTLTLDSQTTASLAFNANSSQIKSALQALFISGVGYVGVNSVTGDMTNGPITINFSSYMGTVTATHSISVTNNTLTGSKAVLISIAETQVGNGGPIYKYCWTYKNMLFLTGNPLQPFSVAPSGIDAFTSFDPSDVFVVKSATATKVTGGYDMDNYCLISTDTDIYLLFGSNPDTTTGDFDLQRSKSQVGCIEQGAGIRVGAGFYFYSGEDIYAFNGVDSVSITDQRIQAYLDLIPISLRRSVYLGYDIERNCLIVHAPISDVVYDNNGAIVLDNLAEVVLGNNYFWTTFTYNLKSGTWGTLLNLSNGSSILGQQPTCCLQMPSDGTQQKNVFFQFGDGVMEWDPPQTTVTATNRTCSLQHAFNYCQSPDIQKDFMRYLLKVKNFQENEISGKPLINLNFYADGDPFTIRQSFTNLVPKNGIIDVLLNGVVGDSLSCAISTPVTYGTGDGVFISGYTAYWQSVEDL